MELAWIRHALSHYLQAGLRQILLRTTNVIITFTTTTIIISPLSFIIVVDVTPNAIVVVMAAKRSRTIQTKPKPKPDSQLADSEPQRLSEVIDRYSRRGLLEGNLKAWTNSGEPPQSPPRSLPAWEADCVNPQPGNGRMFDEATTTKANYQIGVVAGDKNSVVSRCIEFESITNLESSANILYDFDPEIELTLRRIRKVRNTVVSTDSSLNTSLISENSVSTTNTIDFSDFSTTNSFSTTRANRELRLNIEGASHTRCCIPALSDLIHLLSKFHGHAGEGPHKHLKEFHVACSTMRMQGIPEDYIKMKAFPFSLDVATKDWLYLQLVLFNTWGDMKCIFWEKFFPASRMTAIQKEICGIRQHTGETLHKYWEQFNCLCATCPHYQISEQLLVQYFYEGLMLMDQSMIDVASGGALMDKTPVVARHLISNMASNT
ncbi:hypothetical protein CR513_07891, partial [Mucuna pruriens]